MTAKISPSMTNPPMWRCWRFKEKWFCGRFSENNDSNEFFPIVCGKIRRGLLLINFCVAAPACASRIWSMLLPKSSWLVKVLVTPEHGCVCTAAWKCADNPGQGFKPLDFWWRPLVCNFWFWVAAIIKYDVRQRRLVLLLNMRRWLKAGSLVSTPVQLSQQELLLLLLWWLV